MGQTSWEKIRKPFIIIFSCLVGEMIFAILAVCLFSFVDDYTNENKIVFADSQLKYEETTSIKGDVKTISLDEYNNQTSDFYTICNNRGLIFPKAIHKGAISYFAFSEFFYAGGRNIHRTEMFLSWKCPDFECFEQETKRISEILCSNKKIAYCEDLFPLSSYISEYNYKSGFEYAVLNEYSLSIDYVYLHGIGNIDQIVFDKALAPLKLLKDSSFPKDKIVKGHYSIYK